MFGLQKGSLATYYVDVPAKPQHASKLETSEVGAIVMAAGGPVNSAP